MSGEDDLGSISSSYDPEDDYIGNGGKQVWEIPEKDNGKLVRGDSGYSTVRELEARSSDQKPLTTTRPMARGPSMILDPRQTARGLESSNYNPSSSNYNHNVQNHISPNNPSTGYGMDSGMNISSIRTGRGRQGDLIAQRSQPIPSAVFGHPSMRGPPQQPHDHLSDTEPPDSRHYQAYSESDPHRHGNIPINYHFSSHGRGQRRHEQVEQQDATYALPHPRPQSPRPSPIPSVGRVTPTVQAPVSGSTSPEQESLKKTYGKKHGKDKVENTTADTKPRRLIQQSAPARNTADTGSLTRDEEESRSRSMVARLNEEKVPYSTEADDDGRQCYRKPDESLLTMAEEQAMNCAQRLILLGMATLLLNLQNNNTPPATMVSQQQQLSPQRVSTRAAQRGTTPPENDPRTKVRDLRRPVIQQLIILLDPIRPPRSAWPELAADRGMTMTRIEFIRSRCTGPENSPTEYILGQDEFHSLTVEELKQIMTEMERRDVVEMLEKFGF